MHIGWWITEGWFIGITPPPSILRIGKGDRAGMTSLMLAGWYQCSLGSRARDRVARVGSAGDVFWTAVILNRLSGALLGLHSHRPLPGSCRVIRDTTSGNVLSATFALACLQSPAANEQDGSGSSAAAGAAAIVPARPCDRRCSASRTAGPARVTLVIPRLVIQPLYICLLHFAYRHINVF